MNHSQLRAFHAVATEGSFTKASIALRVVQPTLSGHVKALEENYGVELFRRGGRQIEITDFGRLLYEITQRYFSVEAEAGLLLMSASGLVKGRLRVGADSPHCIIPLLASFTRRYPKVSKSVSFGNSSAVLHDILAGHSDIGILPQVKDDKRLHIIPYLTDRLVVLVGRAHCWAQRRSIKLADLQQETVIMREAGSTTRAVFEAALARHGVGLGDTLEMGSREAVREAVAEGMGVGIVGECEVGHDSRLHKLMVKAAGLKIVEFAVCRADRKDDMVITAFTAIVKEMAEL